MSRLSNMLLRKHMLLAKLRPKLLKASQKTLSHQKSQLHQPKLSLLMRVAQHQVQLLLHHLNQEIKLLMPDWLKKKNQLPWAFNNKSLLPNSNRKSSRLLWRRRRVVQKMSNKQRCRTKPQQVVIPKSNRLCWWHNSRWRRCHQKNYRKWLLKVISKPLLLPQLKKSQLQ